ncbi:aspartate/glutamate racemase family protein [Salibacterium sp. K-3]
MKKIGLIGGMSWQSTLHYYEQLNEEINRRLGGMHSASILLESVDFQPIVQAQEERDWETIGKRLAAAARSLEQGGAEMTAISSNTVHAAASYVTNAVPLPFLHIADATARALQEAGVQTTGLIGTTHTMQGAWYRNRLEQYGIRVIVPEETEQQELHRQIFEELCFSKAYSASRRAAVQILEGLRERGAEGVVLGCTEFSILLKQEDSPLPLFDSTSLHVQEIAHMALKQD